MRVNWLCIVWYWCVFQFFIFLYFDIYVFHLPVLSYFFWISFLCYEWGLWMIEGKQMCAQPETQEFLSNSLHSLCTAVLHWYTLHTAHYTCTERAATLHWVWSLINCCSLLRSVLSANVRKRALGTCFIVKEINLTISENYILPDRKNALPESEKYSQQKSWSLINWYSLSSTFRKQALGISYHNYDEDQCWWCWWWWWWWWP